MILLDQHANERERSCQVAPALFFPMLHLVATVTKPYYREWIRIIPMVGVEFPILFPTLNSPLWPSELPDGKSHCNKIMRRHCLGGLWSLLVTILRKTMHFAIRTIPGFSRTSTYHAPTSSAPFYLIASLACHSICLMFPFPPRCTASDAGLARCVNQLLLRERLKPGGAPLETA